MLSDFHHNAFFMGIFTLANIPTTTNLVVFYSILQSSNYEKISKLEKYMLDEYREKVYICSHGK
jgi:hypothetical protein